MSPNYPRKYPNNMDYQWTITAPPQYKVTLQFSYFHVESSKGEILLLFSRVNYSFEGRKGYLVLNTSCFNHIDSPITPGLNQELAILMTHSDVRLRRGKMVLEIRKSNVIFIEIDV